jgi:hypothetical protein
MLALHELVGWHTMDGDALEGLCRLFIHCHLHHVADVRSVLPAPKVKMLPHGTRYHTHIPLSNRPLLRNLLRIMVSLARSDRPRSWAVAADGPKRTAELYPLAR